MVTYMRKNNIMLFFQKSVVITGWKIWRRVLPVCSENCLISRQLMENGVYGQVLENLKTKKEQNHRT